MFSGVGGVTFDTSNKKKVTVLVETECRWYTRLKRVKETQRRRTLQLQLKTCDYADQWEPRVCPSIILTNRNRGGLVYVQNTTDARMGIKLLIDDIMEGCKEELVSKFCSGSTK